MPKIPTSSLILMAILVLAIFFRVYKAENFYVFEHDQDLFSWIVKDIWVDRHFRLIGQLTSIEGVFIGPLFYYLLVPFFVLFKMDPLGALVPSLLIGLFTAFSFYYICTRFFGKTTGLIAAFLYSVTISTAFLDRWVVPTQLTLLWSLWYLYTLFALLKGNSKALLLLGVLFGLIWHIHIALIPLSLLAPIALLLSPQKIKFKQLVIPLLIFFFLTLPFWLFEGRHNFQQIQGLLNSLTDKIDEPEGYVRLMKILEAASSGFVENFFYRVDIPTPLNYFIFTVLTLYLFIRKILSPAQLLLIILWVVSLFLSQLVSKRAISEYYFNNLLIINLFIFSLFFSHLYQRLQKMTIFLLLIFLLINIFWLLKMPAFQSGYLEKKQVVTYIKEHAKTQGYPCAGINYIATEGGAVGFRYLFWLYQLKTIKPTKGIPIYNVVIPWGTSGGEVNVRFGSLGIILPPQTSFTDKKVCDDPSNQLLPLLGFTN